MSSTWAVVVAAGSGSRYGGQKQFEPLGDRRVVDWSLRHAAQACDGVVLVVSPEALTMQFAADRVTVGGDTRSSSVRQGLAALPDGADVVLIHDAARPGASPALFERVEAAVRAGADAAVPALPVADTVKRAELVGERLEVRGTVPRDDLYAVQTPQGFRRHVLERAHAEAGEATDDAGLVEAAGGLVVLVPGEAAAHKITTSSDLALVRHHLGVTEA